MSSLEQRKAMKAVGSVVDQLHNAVQEARSDIDMDSYIERAGLKKACDEIRGGYFSAGLEICYECALDKLLDLYAGKAPKIVRGYRGTIRSVRAVHRIWSRADLALDMK